MIDKSCRGGTTRTTASTLGWSSSGGDGNCVADEIARVCSFLINK